MIKIVFSRTLMSQSAASLTMQSVGGVLRAEDIKVEECLLKRGSHLNGMLLCKNIEDYPVIFGKVNFQDYNENLNLFAELKRQKFVKRIFLFGPFCQLNSNRIMKEYEEIDGIIYNNPEKTALELAKSLMLDQVNLIWNTKIEGALWRDWNTKKLIDTGIRNNGFKLDEMPMPIRDVEKIEFLNIANIEFSRGCIYNCSYCHMSALKNNSYTRLQEKSPEKVIEEIEYLYSSLGKQFFIFNDSLFWRNEKDRERVTEFIKLMKEKNLDINFMVYLSLQSFPPVDIIKELSEVGLMRIFVGVENSNEDTMKKFNKGITVKKFEDIIPILNSFNISYHIGFVIFHPTVTLDEVEENIKYLKNINKLFRVGIIVEKVRLIPGTILYGDTERIPCTDIDTAYSYIIKDLKAEELYQGLKKMFMEVLKGSFREMESFFTSSNMISIYIKRTPIKLSEFNKTMEAIGSVKDEYQEILYLYIERCISELKQNKWRSGDISSSKIHHEFIDDYWRLYYKMQVMWGRLLHIVECKLGEKYTRMISWGREEI
jgi:radical SAM superfamily enzyme YgiQ (UPF0313 family)